MPASMIPSFAKRSGKSEKEVERLWNKAKGLAADQDQKENWEYIVGILKRMLKLESVQSFQEIILLESFMDKVYKEVAEIVKKEIKSIYVFFDERKYGDDYIKEIKTKDYIIKVYKASPADGKPMYKYNFEFVL